MRHNPIVHADSVSKSLCLNLLFSRAGFDVHLHRLCYKTIGSCFSVHYPVMVHLRSLESTREASIALASSNS